MIKIEKVEVVGMEPALRGMRNPMNSWDKSDSFMCDGSSAVSCAGCEYEDLYLECPDVHYVLGPNDLKRAKTLTLGGPVHAKYRRMIVVYLDITAPLYWWKEFDTYKVGTVSNSCSTMHKIQEKEFTLDDFSVEHLRDGGINIYFNIIDELNFWRDAFNNYEMKEHTEISKKDCWWQMIQLLPSTYNQKRTIMLSYEVLANIYMWRKDHKLDEWREFCKWITTLPHAELITRDIPLEED